MFKACMRVPPYILKAIAVRVLLHVSHQPSLAEPLIAKSAARKPWIMNQDLDSKPFSGNGKLMGILSRICDVWQAWMWVPKMLNFACFWALQTFHVVKKSFRKPTWDAFGSSCTSTHRHARQIVCTDPEPRNHAVVDGAIDFQNPNCLYCEMCVIHAVEWLLGFLTAHLKMCCEHCIVQLEHVLKYLGLRHFAGDTPYQILLAPIPPRFKFCFCKVSWAKIIDGDAYHPGLRRWCLPAARVLRGAKGIAQRQHHLVIPHLVHSLLYNTVQSMWVTVGDSTRTALGEIPTSCLTRTPWDAKMQSNHFIQFCSCFKNFQDKIHDHLRLAESTRSQSRKTCWNRTQTSPAYISRCGFLPFQPRWSESNNA